MKQAADIDSVSRLDRDMAEKNLSGYWRLGMEGLPPHPMTAETKKMLPRPVTLLCM